MPSSETYFLTPMAAHIMEYMPKTVLDVGVGYGKYGFLVREYVEVHSYRPYPSEWKVRIDGVEIWQRYVAEFPWLCSFYNNLIVGDICEVLDQLEPKYEMVIMADVLEHIPRQKCYEVARALMARATKCALVVLPIGKQWLNNKIVGGNPYEKHVTAWSIHEAQELATVEVPLRAMYQRTPGRGTCCMFVFGKKILKGA